MLNCAKERESFVRTANLLVQLGVLSRSEHGNSSVWLPGSARVSSLLKRSLRN